MGRLATIRGATARAIAFWKWFEGRADEARRLALTGVPEGTPTEEMTGFVEELNSRTAAYDPRVRALLGQSGDSAELVLTVEGNAKAVEPLRGLVHHAPTIPGVFVRTFKPRLEMSACRVGVGAITLTPENVSYAVIELTNPAVGTVTLVVWFVPGLSGPHSAEFTLAFDQLLQAVLGEERCMIWREYSMSYDSDGPLPENLVGVGRTPLSRIEARLKELDAQLGPVSDPRE